MLPATPRSSQIASHDEDWRRALDVRGALSQAGQARAAGLPDLVVAEVAERERATVLRSNPGYELIAKITGQPVPCIVPPGTVPWQPRAEVTRSMVPRRAAGCALTCGPRPWHAVRGRISGLMSAGWLVRSLTCTCPVTVRLQMVISPVPGMPGGKVGQHATSQRAAGAARDITH